MHSGYYFYNTLVTLFTCIHFFINITYIADYEIIKKIFSDDADDDNDGLLDGEDYDDDGDGIPDTEGRDYTFLLH